MRVEELSVGDYIRFNGSPYIVEEISGKGWIHILDTDTKARIQLSSDYILDSIDGVPLTPEILEKNGFKRFDFHDIEGQHTWSWWLDTLTSVSLWCRELNDDPKDGWMIRIEGTLAMCCHKVEYVHELQQTLRICGVDKEIEL